jgi:hypothetical protein
VYTGDADEEGYAGARKLTWYIESNRVPPQYDHFAASATCSSWASSLDHDETVNGA